MTDWYSKPPASTIGSGTYRGLYVASSTWAVGDIIVPTLAYATAAAKGYVYVCTTAGAGGTEPTWVYTTPGTSTTTDGAAVFTCQLASTWAYATIRPDYIFSNKMVAGEKMYSATGTYTLTTTTTYTLPGTVGSPCLWISTSDTTNAPPTSVATGALMDASATTTGIGVTLSGKGFVYGINMTGGGGGSAASVSIAYADASAIETNSCVFTIPNSNQNSVFSLGQYNKAAFLRTRNCSFVFGNSAGQGFELWANLESINDTITPGTSQPTALFKNGGAVQKFTGLNIGGITSTLFAAAFFYQDTAYFHQCKLGAGVAVMATQTTSVLDVFMTDCSSGNNHYELAHYNYWGNTTISTAIYHNSATDGAAYNAADAKYSWKITGVNGTFATPYVSPWIDKYNEATSAVTPRLEILRDGSATAYNDNQVWGEFSYKGTTGLVTATVVSDICGIVATAAAQAASALGAADWTGEGASAWFGKLEPLATITPVVIGDISARVSVAGAITVYVNPKILGV